MDQSEFIRLLIERKTLDKEIYKLSEKVDDLPICPQILRAIDGNDAFRRIINPKNIGQIDLDAGDLKFNCLYDHKNDLVKKHGIKFLDELVEISKLRLRVNQISDERNFQKEYIIGIDLGTTNSVVAYVENEKAQTIINSDGDRITPSTISVNKRTNKFEVGKYAQNQKVRNPKETFYSIKRFIGRRSSELKASLLNQYPFHMRNKNERIYLYSDTLDKEFTCEEISAQLLIRLKSDAEKFLNTKIKKCVITVPAYFDNNQRKATKTAAEIADLKVERIINEPTAAALAYAIGKKEGNTNTLVFDLGGGTFDISLVSSTGDDLDSFSVVATKGDRELGGDDYSNLMFKFIVGLIKKENSNVLFNLKTNSLIRAEVNRVKHALSDRESEDFNIPFLPLKKNSTEQSFSFEYEITRNEFEEITKSLNSKIKSISKKFLNLKSVKSKKINKVVVVGGASRMPVFSRMISDMTSLRPNIDLNPDEIVALGAAYCAEYKDEKLIVDVNPLSLGVGLIKDQYAVIIPSNTLLPTKKNDVFTTVKDLQKSVIFPIYQGERKLASKNIRLGEIHLKNILIADQGVPKFDVKFHMNVEGILTVTAVDKDTKSEKVVQIENTLDLQPEEIEKLRQLAFNFSNEDQEILNYRDNLIILETWLKIFDKYKDPKLSNTDKNVIDKVKDCLDKQEKSYEDPLALSRSLQIIIQEQDSLEKMPA
ncbi:Hsp70 family protein [Prochlorococcus sp. AH-716-M10]|nr:Hsp70 family protein [Prochlorococcus sp. AH-716-M10]